MKGGSLRGCWIAPDDELRRCGLQGYARHPIWRQRSADIKV